MLVAAKRFIENAQTPAFFNRNFVQIDEKFFPKNA